MGTFTDLVKIVRDGGLEVVTRIDGTGQEDNAPPTTVGEKQRAQEERKTYKIYDTIGIRTTIQLDADCVTMMSPEVLAIPELWPRHIESLKEKLFVLERVQRLALSSSLVLFVIFILPVIPVIYRGAAASDPELVLPLVGALFYRFRNQFIWWLLRCCVRTMWWLSQGWSPVRSWLDPVLTYLFPSRQKDSRIG